MIEKSLAGPIGLFIKFSTLQEYGVDKVFFLENDNVDASQKNIIFLARGEDAGQAIAVAGMYVAQAFYCCQTVHVFLVWVLLPLDDSAELHPKHMGQKSRLRRTISTLLSQSCSLDYYRLNALYW